MEFGVSNPVCVQACAEFFPSANFLDYEHNPSTSKVIPCTRRSPLPDRFFDNRFNAEVAVLQNEFRTTFGRLPSDADDDGCGKFVQSWGEVEKQHAEDWCGLERRVVGFNMLRMMQALPHHNKAEAWWRVNVWGLVADVLNGIPGLPLERGRSSYFRCPN
mmetsp:Transcript_52554/g.122926  ORF Transcript_52554/g.122926 Transcript_52554/m.122926 type:complete len:160 (+) Transcript_52554:456-935(+)